MEEHAPLLDSAMNNEQESSTNENATTESATEISAAWNAADAALLYPSNIPFSRPARAWERKPTSPFARQKLRARKIWKRAAAPRHDFATLGLSLRDPLADRKLNALSVLQSPAKVVKRLCLAPDAAVGTRWERIASPVKRIVTRSDRAVELVALPDEDIGSGNEDEEEVEGTVVEILDEDGQTADSGLAEGGIEDGWADIEPPSGEFDPTLLHLEDAVQHEAEVDAAASIEEASAADSHEIGDVGKDAVHTATPQQSSSSTPVAARTALPAIPAGFVSPVKRQQRSIRRISDTRRRRTLPHAFAPLSTLETVAETQPPTEIVESIQEVDGIADEAELFQTLTNTQDTGPQDAVSGEDADNDDWEDVDEDLSTSTSATAEGLGEDDAVEISQDLGLLPSTQHEYAQDSLLQQPEQSHDPSAIVEQKDLDIGDENVPPSEPTHIAKSPLPIRRSPRRQSSSPAKARFFAADATVPHIVAFNPLKPTARAAILVESHDNASPSSQIPLAIALSEDAPPSLVRSASAPPEEPQSSPRKRDRPRVSDDTALLQAFINRAAESKESRRAFVSKQEHQSNRRDSDTVRHALSSPASANVLLEMDPNSPSPRKTPAAQADDFAMGENIQVFRAPDEIVAANDDQPDLSKNRRSSRYTRRARRGAPSSVNFKTVQRTESQELAALTRNNTRKNKGDAVLPPVLLSQFPEECFQAEVPIDAQTASALRSAKGVRWDETLVYFNTDTSISKLIALGDPDIEAKVQDQILSEVASSDQAIQASTESPGKPRVRRLKAPKAPGLSAEAAQASMSTTTPAAAATPKPRVRRSRIATPAKGLGQESLLPDDLLTPAPVSTDTSAELQTRSVSVPEKRAEPRRRASIKPPLSAENTFSLAPSQDKPGLISSPPKKRVSVFALKPELNKRDLNKELGKGKAEQDSAFELPGMMSPARKLRKAALFGPGTASGAQKDGNAREGGGNSTGLARELPGLASPAKKRTRRLG